MPASLKECPMCGGDACLSHPTFTKHVVSCKVCSLSVHAFLHEAAIAAWNRRVVTQSAFPVGAGETRVVAQLSTI